MSPSGLCSICNSQTTELDVVLGSWDKNRNRALQQRDYFDNLCERRIARKNNFTNHTRTITKHAENRKIISKANSLKNNQKRSPKSHLLLNQSTVSTTSQEFNHPLALALLRTGVPKMQLKKE
jgi:hypothetical protein